MLNTGACGRLPCRSTLLGVDLQTWAGSESSQTFDPLYPPKVTQTRLGFAGSIMMLVTMRAGPTCTRVHVGTSADPLVVQYTSPRLWPTQMSSGLPVATAIAL